MIDSTSNSIKRENALSAQRRLRRLILPNWTNHGWPWFFLLFSIFGKITARLERMEKGKKYLDLRVIFFFFFFLFLSCFLSFHKSKRNSFYLDARFLKKKRKTRNDPFLRQRASKCLTRLSERARFSRVPWFGKHSTSFSIIESSVFIPMSACIFVHPPVLISVFPVNHRMQIEPWLLRFSRRGAKRDFSSMLPILSQSPI